MEKQLIEILNDINKYKTVDKVILVGVTKTRTIEEINKLVNYGVNILGENKPQELRDKYDSKLIDASWHFIGRLQSNKIKYVVKRVDLIHSIASKKLLDEVNQQAIKDNCKIEVLLQVNPSNDENKQGLDESEIVEILKENYSNVKIVGLMSMAPLTNDEQVIRLTFTKAKELYDKYADEYDFKYLSMGMSHDYKIALECGSNMIRIGSKLFEEEF